MFETLSAFRKKLHQHPELSGQEVNTAATITSFLKTHHARVLTGLGGNGVAGIWEYGPSGPTIGFRCELDALPITELNNFAHQSVNAGVSHKCGHDGHMAIVAGLLLWLKEQPFTSGRVVLMFQPAEENGQGAQAVLNDTRFQELHIDYLFALHNLPGYPLHTIITTPAYFSSTVQSVVFHFHGKESHASEPEKGINPASAIAELIQSFALLTVADAHRPDFALLTPVHLNLGQRAYGIAAGEGEVHYTLRTWSEETMATLKSKLLQIVTVTAQRHTLTWDTEWFDYFPAAKNDAGCVAMVEEAAREHHLPVLALPHPFKFGEDFGWYSNHYPTMMFGVGAGETTPALHHAAYDFPDALLPTGIQMFASLIRQLL